MTRTFTLAAALAALGLATTVYGDTIHVPDDEPTIQEAINAAQNGDEILVAPDTYPEVIDFLGKAIVVRSTDGPATTIIDGTGLNASVVTIENGEGTNTVLEGFTITGGTGTDGGTYVVGGGLLCEHSDPVISHCIFRDNSADHGGAIWSHIASPRIRNCALLYNSADNGGGMYNASSANPIITNTTITLNTAAGGGGFYNNSASPRLINCIVYGNTPNSYQGEGVSIITYSDIEGGAAGIGNINADPLFIDDQNGDLRLSPGSPCIDAGDSDAIAVDIFVDLDDEPRGVDDPDTPDTGIPVFALTVDMGACEYQVGPSETCPGDINGDNKVDTADLLILLANWGMCP